MSTRTRSCSILPVRSSTDALIPVPPTSTANVFTAGGVVAAFDVFAALVAVVLLVAATYLTLDVPEVGRDFGGD